MQHSGPLPTSACNAARALALGLTAGLAALVLACGGGDSAASSGTPSGDGELSGVVEIDGSSTVFPITAAVEEEFRARYPDVRVPVGVSGTGGGFSRFCAGETDVSNASRPIKAEEADICESAGIEFIEIPVAYDGLSVVVPVGNDFVTCLTLDELHAIWSPESEGTVTRWSQVRPEWPDETFALYGPGTDSGTFDYFTEVVNGEAQASRADYTPSEDDNVLVQGVAGDPNSLGFFGLAYLEENLDRIKGVAIDGGDGCVEPSPETVEDGSYQPLSRPLFIYVNAASVEKPQVRAFVDFYLENVPQLAGDVGYVRFPDPFYEAIVARWQARETGSIFSGATGSVAQVLQLD